MNWINSKWIKLLEAPLGEEASDLFPISLLHHAMLAVHEAASGYDGVTTVVRCSISQMLPLAYPEKMLTSAPGFEAKMLCESLNGGTHNT